MNLNWNSAPSRFGTALLSLILAIFVITGCGSFDAPTASGGDSEPAQPELWNPAPGDEIVPGREVPLLNDSYWEGVYGPTINPLFGRPGGGGLGGFLGGLVDDVTSVTRFIFGAVGGMVSLGDHYYVVPPGAVNGMVRFTLEYASFTGVGVDCGPSPLAFDVPVMLTLSYNNTQYENSGNPSGLRIWHVTADGTLEEVEGCIVDTNAQTVTAPVTHFSRYILG